MSKQSFSSSAQTCHLPSLPGRGRGNGTSHFKGFLRYLLRRLNHQQRRAATNVEGKYYSTTIFYVHQIWVFINELKHQNLLYIAQDGSTKLQVKQILEGCKCYCCLVLLWKVMNFVQFSTVIQKKYHLWLNSVVLEGHSLTLPQNLCIIIKHIATLPK